MWKTGDPEMATPKRVRTYRPKHSDTSLSREWKINVANKKKSFFIILQFCVFLRPFLSRKTLTFTSMVNNSKITISVNVK